ncbi:MAG: hypothetical protein U0271_38335 [Polyangiaceae bacterium]
MASAKWLGPVGTALGYAHETALGVLGVALTEATLGVALAEAARGATLEEVITGLEPLPDPLARAVPDDAAGSPSEQAKSDIAIMHTAVFDLLIRSHDGTRHRDG